jgi:hypothetical protein
VRTLAISAKHKREEIVALSARLELPSFFHLANCTGKNPLIFDGETTSAVRAAKQICKDCLVLAKCGKWATRTQDFGVWGAMTPAERKRKAKGKRVIDITEMRLLGDGLRRLSSDSPIAQLAVEFKVTSRTIHRWRKKFLNTKKLEEKSYDHNK